MSDLAEPTSSPEPASTPVTTKGPSSMLIAMILLSVAFAAVAQIMLKTGMNHVTAEIAPKEFGIDGDSLRAVVGEPFVWAGLGMFGLSAVVWLTVLSRASLSFAYPFAALTYVLILLYDAFIANVQVPPLRWAGVGLIATGIVLVAQTPHA